MIEFVSIQMRKLKNEADLLIGESNFSGHGNFLHSREDFKIKYVYVIE